jgi:hypothetical protein
MGDMLHGLEGSSGSATSGVAGEAVGTNDGVNDDALTLRPSTLGFSVGFSASGASAAHAEPSARCGYAHSVVRGQILSRCERYTRAGRAPGTVAATAIACCRKLATSGVDILTPAKL